MKQLKFLIPFLLLSMVTFGQLQVKLGTIKTDLRDAAINFSVSYLRSVDSVWGGKRLVKYNRNSIFGVQPDIFFESGTSDAFSSITAKLTGLAIFFQTTEVGGLITPNTAKVFHTMPVSLGIETNSRYDFINSLFELGYVPWYRTANTPPILRGTKFGVFLQAGYKWKTDSASTLPVGGNIDESEEEPDKGIFRLKGSFGINTKPLLRIGFFRLGLVGNADGWYDVVNSATYYKLEGIARIHLNSTTFIDFEYQSGSGAPLFNKGDQFGVGLAITF